MATILIVNSENRLFEYEIAATAADYRKPEDVALDRYIEEQLGFDAQFNMSKCLYDYIKLDIDNICVKMALINHLCSDASSRISKLFNGNKAFVPGP